MAEAEREYKKAYAIAFLQAEGTVAESTQIAERDTAELRYAKTLAEGLERSALEAIRSRRQKISALQSLTGAYKEEGAFERTGPK